MLPRKKQKIEQTAEATSSGGRGQYASGSQNSLQRFHDTALKEGTPEPSGNLETDLTEVAVLQRRKRHLQELCGMYQAQLSGLPPDTTSTAGIRAAAPDLQGSVHIANQCIQDKLQHISRLEQLSAAASNRELDSRRALAMFCGKHMRYFVKATTIDLGRSTTTLGKVDIDLTQEGSAKKVSRQQAQLALHADGRFLLTNIGRRIIHVNGNQLMQNHGIHLEHLSVVNFAGIPLLFVVNLLAVHRLVARSQNLVL